MVASIAQPNLVNPIRRADRHRARRANDVVSDSFHKRPPSILAFVVLGRKYASKTLVWSIAAKVIPGTCPADSVYSADSAGLASFSRRLLVMKL
jgi:hypothetical protein